MKTESLRLLARRAAVVLALAAAGAALPAQAQTASMLSIQTGASVILRAPGIRRVAVGDGRIAGVLPIGTSQLVINGKAPGVTTVIVWEGAGRATYDVTVTEQTMNDLAHMLRSSIAYPNVQVQSFNNSVVVRGVVADGAEFATLSDLLGRFDTYARSQHDTIVNAVEVAHPLGDIQQALAGIPGAGDIRVDPDGKGNVIVSGRVHDEATAQAVLQRAKGLSGAYLAANGKLIDRIATDTTSQIDVKVYVLEVDNTAMKNLGVQLQSAVWGNNGYTLGAPSFPVVEPAQLPLSGGALKVGPFFRTITLAPTLNLLVQEGHARVLSSPNLVTTPGNKATFLVGGEVPVPFSTGLGQVSIEYKQYGVQLNVTPTIMGNGAVDADIEPNISDLDFADGVTENGFVIPALKESRLQTDVITQPGESIIMGGLVRRVEQRTIQKVPLLGDIPILGQLFRSTRYQKDDSDVVFVMTPTVLTR